MDPASSFGVVARASEIDQYAAHDLCRDGEEVRPVLPLNILPIDQPDESLIDQRRGLKGMARPLSYHVSTSQTMQVVVDQRRELLESRLIAVSPVHKHLGDLLLRRCSHTSFPATAATIPHLICGL